MEHGLLTLGPTKCEDNLTDSYTKLYLEVLHFFLKSTPIQFQTLLPRKLMFKDFRLDLSQSGQDTPHFSFGLYMMLRDFDSPIPPAFIEIKFLL